MNGTFSKRVDASHLACQPCAQFRDTDPDVFYCDQHHAEFPALCDAFAPRSSINLIEPWKILNGVYNPHFP